VTLDRALTVILVVGGVLLVAAAAGLVFVPLALLWLGLVCLALAGFGLRYGGF
jgi:hypothetical protein